MQLYYRHMDGGRGGGGVLWCSINLSPNFIPNCIQGEQRLTYNGPWNFQRFYVPLIVTIRDIQGVGFVITDTLPIENPPSIHAYMHAHIHTYVCTYI